MCEETFYSAGKFLKISGSKQLNSFRKSLQLTKFIRPLPLLYWHRRLDQEERKSLQQGRRDSWDAMPSQLCFTLGERVLCSQTHPWGLCGVKDEASTPPALEDDGKPEKRRSEVVCII